MSDRPNEPQSGSSSASGHTSGNNQPEYGQRMEGNDQAFGQNDYPRSQQNYGSQQPEYGQYGDSQSNAQQYGNDQYGNRGYGNQSQYGDQPYGNDQYGHQGQQGYGNQGYGNDQYGHQAYGPGGANNPTYYQNDYNQQGYGNQDYYGNGKPAGNGLGIASLVLGIIGILTFWFFGLGGLVGLVGLILGIVALTKLRKTPGASKAMPIVGIILSALSIIGGILMAAFFFWIFDMVSECMPLVNSGDQAAYEQCVEDVVNQNMGIDS